MLSQCDCHWTKTNPAKPGSDPARPGVLPCPQPSTTLKPRALCRPRPAVVPDSAPDRALADFYQYDWRLSDAFGHLPSSFTLGAWHTMPQESSWRCRLQRRCAHRSTPMLRCVPEYHEPGRGVLHSARPVHSTSSLPQLRLPACLRQSVASTVHRNE